MSDTPRHGVPRRRHDRRRDAGRLDVRRDAHDDPIALVIAGVLHPLRYKETGPKRLICRDDRAVIEDTLDFRLVVVRVRVVVVVEAHCVQDRGRLTGARDRDRRAGWNEASASFA
jgi:hypothetical protein